MKVQRIKQYGRGLVLAGCIFGLGAMSAAAHATQWLMASGYADNNYLTVNLRELIADIEETTGGELKIQLHSNGTLIALDAIRRAVQSNQVQMGEIRLGTFGNEDPMYVLDAVPYLANNYDRAWDLLEEQRPYFDRMFDKLGLKAIAYTPWPPQGFYTKEPLDTLGDFKDKTIRIYSKYTQKMGNMLHARTVTLPFAEIPQAFATGMIDALFTSPQIGIDIQAWDNTNYYTVVGALNTKNAIVVNKKAFNRLPADQQEAVLKAGKRASERGWKLSETSFKEQLAILEKNGIKVQQASDEIMKELHRIGDVLVQDWRDEADDPAEAVLDAYLQKQ